MEVETDQDKNVTDIHTRICNVFRNKRIMRGLQKRSVHIHCISFCRVQISVNFLYKNIFFYHMWY